MLIRGCSSLLGVVVGVAGGSVRRCRARGSVLPGSRARGAGRAAREDRRARPASILPNPMQAGAQSGSQGCQKVHGGSGQPAGQTQHNFAKICPIRAHRCPNLAEMTDRGSRLPEPNENYPHCARSVHTPAPTPHSGIPIEFSGNAHVGSRQQTGRTQHNLSKIRATRTHRCPNPTEMPDRGSRPAKPNENYPYCARSVHTVAPTQHSTHTHSHPHIRAKRLAPAEIHECEFLRAPALSSR